MIMLSHSSRGHRSSPQERNRVPVNVVYLIDHIWSRSGGTEGQLLNLIEGIDRHRFRPQLKVLYAVGESVRMDVRSCEYDCFDLRSLRQSRSWLTLKSFAIELRRERPAILHTVFPESATLGPLLARVAGVPHLTWRRDLGYWLTPIKRRLLRATTRWTATCVANSEAVRGRVIMNEGFRRDQVVVVRNSVNMVELEAVRPVDIASELGLSRHTVTLVFPANLRPVKGADVALAALSRIIRAGARVHLVSAGENSQLIGGYRRLCDQLGIGDHVTFLGHLRREDLLRWIKGSDVVLNASYSEGYCNSIVEAMLLERPVIATAVGGNLEQVIDGETGVLVAAGDAEAMARGMLELAGDPERRRLLGRAGAARMRLLHGADETVQRHEALYDRILENQGVLDAS